MTEDRRKKTQHPRPKKSGRPILRIVATEEPRAPEKPQTQNRSQGNSRFVDMMKDYCDQLDREIELYMNL